MFKHRSYQPELLDAEYIPKEDLYQNLRELDFINTWLGGHDITVKGIKKLITKSYSDSISIADVGCGGGDNLKAIANWSRKNGVFVRLIGIDIKDNCIHFAKENCKDYPEITFIQSDYRLVNQHFDIILSALFCHHLNDDQMVEYLSWCQKYSDIGFLINDLERNPLAYHSIKILTSLFSKSYLVKNDAPLSVARGFKRSEIEFHMKKASIPSYLIRWMWAFRYLIIAKK